MGNQLDHGIHARSGLKWSPIFLLATVVVFLAVNDLNAKEDRMEECCRILELRQYQTVPGQRDTLIRLFDTHFIESQEETGMFLVGQFRDRNKPDRFVWIRGFPDMASREKALTKFYMESPAWKEHRTAANETMVDVSNVLLLRPSHVKSAFRLNRSNRPSVAMPVRDGGVIIATIHYFSNSIPSQFVRAFETEFMPVLENLRAPLLGSFITEESKNNFPRLPVREDVKVFVWFTSFTNESAYESFRQEIGKKFTWFEQTGVKSTEVLELLPTSRSLLRAYS